MSWSNEFIATTPEQVQKELAPVEGMPQSFRDAIANLAGMVVPGTALSVNTNGHLSSPVDQYSNGTLTFKFIRVLTCLLFAMCFVLSARAQSSTNALQIPQWLEDSWNLIAPIAQATNHTAIVFGGLDLNHAETVNGKTVNRREPLGGVGDIYNFSKNFGLFVDFQYQAPHSFSGVSGSLMFQVPIYLFGGTNFFIAPNTYIGLMNHLSGEGPLNGSVDALAGAGASVKVYKWLNAFGEYEQRQNSGEKVLLVGVAIKIMAGDGTGILGLRHAGRRMASVRGLESFD